MAKTCYYCGPENGPPPAELRPFGPGGSWVCFACATATPERNAAAQSAYGALLDASSAISPSGAVVLSEEGPVPFDPKDTELGG